LWYLFLQLRHSPRLGVLAQSVGVCVRVNAAELADRLPRLPRFKHGT